MAKRYAVWGCGPSTSRLIRGAEEHSEAAFLAAQAAGFPVDDMEYPSDQFWYIEVVANEDDLDAQTRFDSAVAGYCELGGEEEDVCRHDGCGAPVADMSSHLEDHRTAEADLESERCCAGCGYHAAVWIVVRGGSTAGAWIVERSGCECDDSDRRVSKADIHDEIYFSPEDADAGAEWLNEMSGKDCVRDDDAAAERLNDNDRDAQRH